MRNGRRNLVVRAHDTSIGLSRAGGGVYVHFCGILRCYGVPSILCLDARDSCLSALRSFIRGRVDVFMTLSLRLSTLYINIRDIQEYVSDELHENNAKVSTPNRVQGIPPAATMVSFRLYHETTLMPSS